MKSLKEIATFFGTDKEVSHSSHGEGHKYCDFYDHHLSKLKLENLKIFEIGIFDGASLKMWEEYFPNSLIYGIDLIIEPKSVLINEGRIKSFKLDAGYENNLLEFEKTHGPFDIVIDDGSHFTNHQFLSWDLFNNKCKVFIWEDLHTSRMPHYMRGTNELGEYPLDAAIRMSKNEKNCFLFDRDGDEKHVTFVKINI
jgi:hypothetical protein